VRNSVDRARWEAGEGDSPHEIENHPRTKELADAVRARGCSGAPQLQLSRIPHSQGSFFQGILGEAGDCTQLLWNLREV
jgi:hypothetical protein